MSQSKRLKVKCNLHDTVIIESDCKPVNDDPRCLTCPLGPKCLEIASDIENSDQSFYDLFIKKIIDDKSILHTLSELPDKNFVKKVIENSESDQVSDELFFFYLRRDFTFLFSKLAFRKIKRWKELRLSNDNDKSECAKENLYRIGTELAFKGWDKSSIPLTVVAKVRHDIYERIKKMGYKKTKKWNEQIKLKKLFIDYFGPEFISDLMLRDPESFKKSPGVLADILTGVILELSSQTIETYRKRTRKVTLSNGSVAFELKPHN